ncbi:MAG: hypothetical protein RR326_12765, partial [Stenotrophomonas sp.]
PAAAGLTAGSGGAYMNTNFTRLFAEAPGLTAQHAYQLAYNSIDASFADPQDKQKWTQQLRDCFDQAAS